MRMNKKYVFATIILLCLLFCMASCKKPNPLVNTGTTELTIASITDRNSDINSKVTTYVYRTAEEWGVKMPEMKLNPEDPYSVKIKEIYENIKNTPDSDKKVFVEYDQYLDQAIYALYDLDGDGKKELITGWNQYEGEYVGYYNESYSRAAKGKKKMVTHLYSVDESGKVIEWDFYSHDISGELVDQVILSDGTIKSTMGNAYGYDDHYSYRYVKLDKGKMVAFQKLSDYSFYKDNYKTKTERADKLKKITKEEFFKIKDEWEKDNPEVKLDWQPIHTYGQ